MKKNMKIKKHLKKESGGRKGLSPVVSTIILIMIVLVIAIIIILWFRVFFKEVVLKDVAGTSKRAEDFCNDLQLRAISNPDGSFGISNEGNVAVNAIVLKTSSADGSSETSTRDIPVNPGYSKIIMKKDGSGPESKNDYSEVKIIPILMGKKKGDLLQRVTCPEKYAVKI